MNTPENKTLINPDDPKWTAYVLGELEESERREIELLLDASEEARALVEELTLATASMKQELSAHMPLMLSAEQKAAIRSAAEPKPRRWLEMFPSGWGLGVATAAVLVAAVVLPLAMRKPKDAPVLHENSPAAVGPVAPVTLPEVSIVHNAPAASEGKEVSLAKQADKKSDAATAAPVMTPQQFAKAAQDSSAGPSPAAAIAVATTPATLGGTVVDETSALIPGVTITATNSGTGAALTTQTNQSGAYRFADLPPGTYQVSAALPGFQMQTVKDLSVGPSDAALVNYTLAVGSVSTTLQVTVAESQAVAKSAASVGEVGRQGAAELPRVRNDVLDLIARTQDVRNGEREEQDQKLQNTVVSGLSAGNVNVTRDGISTEELRKREAAPPPPPPPPPVAAPAPPPPQLSQGQQGQQGQQAGNQGLQGQQGQQGGGQFNNANAAGGGGGGGGGGRGGRGGGGAARGAAPATGAGATGGVLGGILTPPNARAAAPPPPAPIARADRINAPVPNNEAYDQIVDNPFVRTAQENLATFSIDVDTAAYANVRRFLNQNQIPPVDAVRIEELVNYFNYDYAQPTGNAPIAPNMEVAAAPWNPSNRLLRIGIKAREVNANRRPPSNLVFLIDVSGSMAPPERLPLVKAGLNMLVEQLGENDMVSIVVYAGNSGLVLAPTSGQQKEKIRQAIDNMQAGGSTNGGAGIQLAYNQATLNFMRGGVNRVILMTDGDFNVGVTNQNDLTRLIEERAKSGVFLSVLGFGMGNYKDSTLERLADRGNGNYAYIDNIREARKVLVEEMSGTLVTVAKDVKIQVDFNPAKVEAYRLIGYENRILRTEDFNNDAKDAGDMGAGHTVTALFEVVPKGGVVPGPSVEPSKYLQPAASADAARGNVGATSNELLTLRVRYKLPDADTSTKMDVPLVDRGTTFARATTDFRFAAGVAEFGMILRNSPYRGSGRMDAVLDIVGTSLGTDRNGYRKEFMGLVERAKNLGR